MTIKPGAIRFNTDSMKLEIFRGSANYEGTASMAGIGTLAAGQWEEIQATSPEVQTGGTRALFGGGYSPGNVNTIDYANLDSTGNAIDFGNLTQARYSAGALASRTRGVWGGGNSGPNVDTIDYVTISSTGDAIDFGDLVSARAYVNGLSNQTRGLFFGGTSPTLNIIEYITIASTGDAIDFGDLSVATFAIKGCASSTRGIFSGGQQSTPVVNTIEFVEISTLGNAADFGDLTVVQEYHGALSNAIRGIFGGGQPAPNPTTCINNISYITIATLGNALDFGDLSHLESRDGGAAASSTRGVFAGGDNAAPPYTKVDHMDYIQIMTTGNSIDFGNLTDARNHMNGCSNGHGGL